nr:MAG TPA: hypothetical protein [Caudoviricetes sp.]
MDILINMFMVQIRLCSPQHKDNIFRQNRALS